MEQLPLFSDSLQSPEHSVETLAYIAGLFDAEGNVCIAADHPRPTNQRATTSYFLRISMANTSKPVLEWIKDIFAGSLTLGKSTRLPCWSWTLQGEAAALFLGKVMPFLKVKQPQASVAIKFQHYHQNHVGNPGRPPSQQVLEKKEEYHQQIKGLNAATRSLDTTALLPTNRSPETLAYIAGFFDGEGTIKVGVKRPGQRIRQTSVRLWPSHSLQIILANTDLPTMQWIQAIFAGYLTTNGNNHKHKIVYIWKLGSDTAQQFLALVLPYMKIKGQQAALAIEFQDYHRSHSNEFACHCTQEVLTQKEEYRQHINALCMHKAKPKDIEEWLDA